MTTMEQLIEPVKFMVERQAELGTLLSQQHQHQTTNMELQKGGKEWDNISIYRSVKPFCGNPKDWEEFSEKLKSQVAAGDMLAASVLDVVETQVSETNLQEDGYYVYVAEDDTCSEDQIIKISTKLHNLPGEANAVVRRCRGRHGLLAWKRLCTTLDPRTLASGVVAEGRDQARKESAVQATSWPWSEEFGRDTSTEK